MKKSLYILELIVFISLSCKSNNETNLKLKESRTFQQEKMILYHEDSIVAHDRQHLFLQNLESVMKLPKLRSLDGLYVRIWLWGFEKKYVIDICKEQAVSKCSVFEFNSRKVDSSEYIIIHNEIRDIEPTSGWTSFFSSLDRYKILMMKSGKPFEKQTDYQIGMSYVQFEIMVYGQYHFYEYLEPSYYKDVNVGSNNIYQFLKYFDQQMNVHFYPPPSNHLIIHK